MTRTAPVATRAGLAAATIAAALLLGAGALPGQSVMDRTPNVEGPWSTAFGQIQFNFLHRFGITDPPTRKVFNSPTFLLAAGLPSDLDVGLRYASNSVLVSGTPNEFEGFARWVPVRQERGWGADVGLQVAYNRAANSADAELALGRAFGPVKLLAAGRAFSAYRGDDAEVALAGGARWQLTDHVALAADVGGVVGADSADAVWGAGLHMGIPFTPHSFSVHVSNANTSTLQGSSRAAGDRRWGFEFTVPITLSRFFGDSGGQADGGDAVEVDPDAPAADAVVEMDNRLRFLPDTVRVPVDGVVEWRNTSDIVHTVTGDPERAMRAENVIMPAGAERYDSGDLAPGARFRHTFREAGVYRYVCVPHEAAAMVGVVIVE